MADKKEGALAIFRAAAAAKGGAGVAAAYQSKLFAELNARAVGAQMEEINERTELAIRDIQEKGKRVVSEQEMAFVKGGVKLEGSAMDVISETLANVAEASYIRRREADYQLIGLAGQRAGLKEAGSDLNFLLNVAAVGGEAYAGYQMSKARLKIKGTKERALGLGSNTLDERAFRASNKATALA